jgi:hypothetical protein
MTPLKELASKTHQSTRTASTTNTTTLTLHVHLKSHLGSMVNRRLLITRLDKARQLATVTTSPNPRKENIPHYPPRSSPPTASKPEP